MLYKLTGVIAYRGVGLILGCREFGVGMENFGGVLKLCSV